jgi:hypothetical protein
MLESIVQHLMDNVFPAAADYGAAVGRLSDAYAANPDAPDLWAESARDAKRQAAELAIAIDGLSAATLVYPAEEATSAFIHRAYPMPPSVDSWHYGPNVKSCPPGEADADFGGKQSLKQIRG